MTTATAEVRRTHRETISHGVRHTLLRPAFWLGMTLGFPFEHMLWQRCPGLSWITLHVFGLT